MRISRKFLSVCLSLLMLLTITVSGTMAFEYIQQNIAAQADEAADELRVNLLQESDTKDPDFQLFPAFEGLSEAQIVQSEQFANHTICVENTGDVTAFVRIAFAIPVSLDTENEQGTKALHIIESGSQNWSEARVIRDVNVNEVVCNVYIYNYKHKLDTACTTQDSTILGFYLDSAVTNDSDGYRLGNERLEVYENGTFHIPAAAQAVQTDGFEGVDAAFSGATLPSFSARQTN